MCKLFLILMLFSIFNADGQTTPMRMLFQNHVSASCGIGSSNYGSTGVSSTSTNLQANYIYWTNVTATACGTVISVSWYIGATTSSSVIAAIYSDSAGKPNTLLTNGVSNITSESSNQYNTYTFVTPPSVSAGTSYWIGLLSNAAHAAVSTGGSQTLYYQSRTYSLGFATPATPTLGSPVDLIGAYITVQH